MEDSLKRFDMDAISKAFYEFVNDKKPQPLGKFFRDVTGIRWKYIARIKSTFIASHGEYGAVMDIERQPGGARKITVQLKKAQ